MRICALIFIPLVTGCGSDPDPTTSAAGSGGASTSTTSAAGAGGAAGSTSSTGGGGGVPDPPASLTRYLTGDEADADVVPAGPGVILMGGGTDVDAAFTWWAPKLAGGDVVVLRTSGSDGYNDYLYGFGDVDSVETLLVDSAALADDPYVAWRIATAEGIFIAGGDQATYMTLWKDRAVENALMQAHVRGAIIGGTSAGCAVLGEVIFAAYNDTVYSDEALADPYNRFMQLDREFLGFTGLAGVITDTHFAERDRMGRLIGFVARAINDGWLANASGLGIDEATALVVDETGRGEVMGSGAVYLLKDNGVPQQCAAGMTLEYADLSLHALRVGDVVQLPEATTSVVPSTVSAANGVTIPASPY